MNNCVLQSTLHVFRPVQVRLARIETANALEAGIRDLRMQDTHKETLKANWPKGIFDKANKAIWLGTVGMTVVCIFT